MENEQTPSKKVTMKPEFMQFQIEYARILNNTRTLFDTIIDHPETPFDAQMILDGCHNLMPLCKTTVDLFDKLHHMRLDNDSIYAHCLNVALIARMMGKWLKFSPDEKDLLTLCGILHDIGKTSIPDEVLNKPGKYTEQEFLLVQRHTLFGYQLLTPLRINEHIKNSALQHHEFCDGSGYPYGRTSDEIDEFAAIIAIADVYDAMTAARSYRSPLCPFQAIHVFEKDGLQRYHPKYILTFLNHIANAYQNNRVLLNNGQSATIVMINSSHLTKPLIQLDSGDVIDMNANPELEIIKII